MKKYQTLYPFFQNILGLQISVFRLLNPAQPIQNQLKLFQFESNQLDNFWISPKSFEVWYRYGFGHDGRVFQDLEMVANKKESKNETNNLIAFVGGDSEMIPRFSIIFEYAQIVIIVLSG